MTVELAAVEQGEGRPLVIMHGLFGSARNWGAIAKRLAETRRVVALDLRNHGASPWAAAMTYADLAADVEAFLDRRALAPATLVGHSMGGKTAMMVALRHPELVERLVVVDIAPVTYAHTHLPYVRAMQAVDFSQARRRADVDRMLAAGVPDAMLRLFLMQNLVQDNGRFAWRINLDAIGAAMSDLIGFPDVSGRRYDGPTLFLSGAKSDYVRPEHHAGIKALFPEAVFAAVEGAGHWVHAEQPEALVRQVSDFL